MSHGGYVHVRVDKIKRVTEKALLAVIEDEEVWIPLSQISDEEDYDEGDSDVTLSVTEWIAREKGLEGE